MGKFIGRLEKNLGFNKIFARDAELTKIIIENRVFFNLTFDFTSSVDFKVNPENKLDADRFFYVDYSNCDSDIKDIIQSYFNAVDSTAEMSTLNKANLSKMEFLIYGKKIASKFKLNLQAITPKYFIHSKSYLKVLDSHIEYKHEKDVLEFKDELSIHIDEQAKKIYFRHFSDLKKIHKKFIKLYNVATPAEQTSFIDKVNDYDLFLIDQSKLKLQPTNLKKLKYVLDNEMLSEVFKKPNKVKKYIKKFKSNLELTKTDGKFIITNNKEFTSLMKVINENYYEGEITGKKRESNSTEVLGS